MFNTVLTPNSELYPWAFCASAAIGDAEFVTASSNHPGGVNILMADGSVRFVEGLDQSGDLVGPGHAS